MKKSLFILVLLLSSVVIYAQRNRDLIYLKNGSVIKGVVLEQNYVDDCIKIQTSDGSLFVYRISEVEKIQKEEIEEESYGFLGGNGLYRKCRLIVEPGYVFGVEHSDYKEDRVGGTVAAGYQFNPFVFLGTGAGIYYYVDSRVVSIPVFLNFRSDFINAKFNPFVDVKAGYSPAKDVEGAYASVSLGCRLRLGNSCGLSLSLGSEIQSAIVNYTYVTYYKYKNNTYDYSSERKDIWGLFTKIGIDF